MDEIVSSRFFKDIPGSLVVKTILIKIPIECWE